MKEYEVKIPSKCDGLLLSCYIVEPDKIKGIFQIAHGMAEPKERYLDFMRFLAASGYLCIINDHRGHGKSVKSESDLGYFYDPSCTYIVEDIHDIGQYYKNKYKVPLTLFGHSMGALVVREVLKKYDTDINQLIVCGSPSQNSATKLAILLTKTMILMKGDHYKSNTINGMALGGYQKRFNEDVENTWLSYNRQNVFDYNASKYCGFTFTLNGFLNLFTMMDDVYNPKGWVLKHKQIPIYFIAGEDDPCIDNEKKWKESMDFLKDLGYKNITYTMYHHMRHEILQEDEHMNVYEDVLKFIEEQKK